MSAMIVLIIIGLPKSSLPCIEANPERACMIGSYARSAAIGPVKP